MSNSVKARSLRTPWGVLPAWASSPRAHKGMELVDLKSLGLIPGVAGGDRGISAQGDILTQTLDGMPINDLWNAYQDSLDEYNQPRTDLVSFLTYRTTEAQEPYFTTGARAEFEEATEYGEPVGYRPTAEQAWLGYTMKWYDLAARFTWQFLANAPASQVDSIANMALEADNRLLFNNVMKTLFNNTRRVNERGTTVYPFYSGAAGDDPPDVGSTTFGDNHNHYVITGNAALTASSVEALYNNIAEHGYKRELGYELVLMVNKAQADYMRNWRSLANITMGGGTATAANGGGLYDFIPAQGDPSFLLPETFRVPGNDGRPAATLRGMKVVGSYGEWTIVENEYIPANYLVGFATGGPQNVTNPIAIREHPNASLRGLRLVKGRTPDYPLIDSFYNHGFGTGIKWRGAGAILQIKASGTYDVPSQYAW